MSTTKRVALVTLGCARNEVDSEELAGRLGTSDWELVEDADDADIVVVNTCGFIEQAKKDSVDALLEAAEGNRKVVAVGCMAERYGTQLADELPEASAVLGFDSYADIALRLDDVLAGREVVSHTPRDRRQLLPIAPVDRQAAAGVIPGHDGGVQRVRLTTGPVASIKLASGCDRRCAFCAIPRFRGSFVSRTPEDVLIEAVWLAGEGVRELVLVSENSTSYGKDLGDVRMLETLLPALAAIDGIERVRVAYLQPAEMRPGLVQVIASTPGVAPYFDLSFQHASEPVLRRMRRFGNTASFVGLLEQARAISPLLGARTNVIVGFPGETEGDLEELERFLTLARLDAVGVFGYSDEEGTEAVGYDGKLDADVIEKRRLRVTDLVEELTSQRADERIGEIVDVLIEEVTGALAEGRALHQAPEVDGSCIVRGAVGAEVGQFVRARVVATEGVDLIVEAVAG